MCIAEIFYSIFLKTNVPGHQTHFTKNMLHIIFEELMIFKQMLRVITLLKKGHLCRGNFIFSIISFLKRDSVDFF
jgi:hypothetical protein